MSRTISSVLIGVALVGVLGVLAETASANQEQDRERISAERRTADERADRHRAIIEHLEHAIVALNELGNTEIAMELDRVTDLIRDRVRRNEQRRERRDSDRRDNDRREGSERDIVRGQIEALRSALSVLREAKREDAADLVHRAIRAREIMLEGRRDEEARTMRERAPRREQVRELLGLSVELCQDFGQHERAEELARAARELFPQRERDAQRERVVERERDVQRDREVDRERDRQRGPDRNEREHLAYQIVVMRSALPAIREAERPDTAELLEHAIHARELMLEGARGEDAARIIETAPKLGAVVEILAYASRLWEEFGHERKAAIIGELAEQMGAEYRARRERNAERERARDRDAQAEVRQRRIRELEERLAELEAALERTRNELREVRGRR
jgi:hypothetical protein